MEKPMPEYAASDYITSRRVGEAQVTIISDGTLTWTPHFPVAAEVARAAMPEAGPSGELLLGLNVCLVQLDGATILIDPGCDDPDSTWQAHFATRFPPSERSPGFAAALAELGIAPEQVTYVPITHAHSDHYAGVVIERDGRLDVRFPNARHLIGRADWEGNPQLSNPESDLAQRMGAVAALGLLDAVDDRYKVVPGVTLLATPGESPGHIVVRVSSGGEHFYFLGDLIHHACEAANPDWVSHGDAAQARISRERVFSEMAANGGLCVAAHELFPGWRRVVRSGDGYSMLPAGQS
jgi:glyoxylase-like metal-dependent hydrolase (beta-lactamase superfamily II)